LAYANSLIYLAFHPPPSRNWKGAKFYPEERLMPSAPPLRRQVSSSSLKMGAGLVSDSPSKTRKTVLPGWPRGLSEDLAAAYVGLSKTTFRTLWAGGDIPNPVKLSTKRQVWYKEALDEWLDRKAGITPASAPTTNEWLVAIGKA